jgi:two-component system response regulator MtrA
MSLDSFGSRWQELAEQLTEHVTVLIVDDEPLVAELLGSVVEDSGWRFEIVDDAEAALTRARGGDYDLIIVDKNLPGHDGIDLIGQLAREGNQTPCVLVTGFPSTETISRALAEGAVDYISKPFDVVGHLQKRLTSIVDQRRQARVVAQMVRDLSAMTTAPDVDELQVRELGMELFAHKQQLAERPDALILDVEQGLAEQIGRVLERSGVRVVYAEADALAAVRDKSPMCVFVTLDVPGAANVVEQVRGYDPALGVIVSGSGRALADALASVKAGATDFVLGSIEGPDVLVRRVKRAVARARKLKLQQRLVTLLARVAAETGVALPAQVTGLLRDVSGEGAPVIEGLPNDIDIGDLFLDDEAPSVAEGDGPMEIRGANEAAALSSEGTTLEQQIEYGLASVPEERRQQVATRELLRAYRTLVETIRFFGDVGQPSAEDLARFLGDDEEGAKAAWLRAYTELRAALPDDVTHELDYGRRFAHPWPPWWLKR